MTVGAFVCLLVAIMIAGGGLMIVSVLNMDAGEPYLRALKELYWPFATAAVVMLIGAYQSQRDYWKKRKSGVTEGLPATMSIGKLLFIAGAILLWISVDRLSDLLLLKHTRFDVTPVILLLTSFLLFWGARKLRKKK